MKEKKQNFRLQAVSSESEQSTDEDDNTTTNRASRFIRGPDGKLVRRDGTGNQGESNGGRGGGGGGRGGYEGGRGRGEGGRGGYEGGRGRGTYEGGRGGGFSAGRGRGRGPPSSGFGGGAGGGRFAPSSPDGGRGGGRGGRTGRTAGRGSTTKFDRRVQDGGVIGRGRPKDAAFGGAGASDRLKKGRKSKAQRMQMRKLQAEEERDVATELLEVPKDGLMIEELMAELATTQANIIKILFMKGIAVQMGQMLDRDAVVAVAEDMAIEWIDEDEKSIYYEARKVTKFNTEEDQDFLEPRPAVVTIMGHVDHGKTSLLDYIRKTKVAAGEAGGITQGIGAYQIKTFVGEDEQETTITFLDTPGHEAFSAMRARGARVTDIAIIIVAADDGLRPQTEEAVAHAQAADVPIIVAINKIDKPAADIEFVRGEMAKVGLTCEEWGGQTPMIPISAKTGEGIDYLLETIALQSEISELSANPNKRAVGSIIEAQLDKQRGSIATLLVQAGTLKIGDAVTCGEVYGKVRAMETATGERIEMALPSTPVAVLGLSGVPVAGDEFEVCESEQEAREKAEKITEESRNTRLGAVAGNVASLTNISGLVDSALQTINLIIKADVSGSTEAIKFALMQLPQDRVQLRFLMSSVGEVSESDVDLASASGGIILAFNTPASDRVVDLAKRRGVEIRKYDVIYGLIDEVRDAMEGKLSEVKDEVSVGKAEVKAVFGGGSSKVAGSIVTEGSIKKGMLMRVIRGSKRREVYNGKVGSLRRFKDAVKKVDNGEECGIGADPEWPDFQQGDIIECFELVERKQTLESASETLKEQVAEYRSKDDERAAKAAAEADKFQKRRGAVETPPK